MASLQVNICKEMMDMVRHFRVTELQELLVFANKKKNGKKNELLERALLLVQTDGHHKDIQHKILELYSKRYPNRLPIDEKFSALLSNRDQTNGQPPENHHPYVLNQNHQEPQVKLKQLPFYKNLSSVLPVFPLGTNSTRCFREIPFSFSQSQIEDLSASYSTQNKVQLRFCLFDTTKEQEDKLPPELEVQLNGYSIKLPPVTQPTKAGVKPKQQHRPLDVTEICKNVGFRNHFSLTIKWYNESHQNFAVTVNLVQQLSISDLLQKLNVIGPISPSDSRQFIREKLASNPESEIATTSFKVSLLCPLGKMRMKYPARATNCRHLQCFDASSFLMMNERKPTWICPVCDRPAEFSNLRMDGLFLEIIRTCESDEIEFTENGNWHSAKKKLEDIHTLSANKPIDLSQTSIQNSVEQETNSKSNKVVATIDLTIDSSDDDEPIPSSSSSKSPFRAITDTPVSLPSPPLDSGNHIMTDGFGLNSPYTSHHNSPQQRVPNSYISPSRSPYCQRDSPHLRHRSSQSHPYAPKSLESSRQTPIKLNPPVKPPASVIPNGLRDQHTQNAQSPYLHNSTTPVISNYGFSPFELPLNGITSFSDHFWFPSHTTAIDKLPLSYLMGTMSTAFVPPYLQPSYFAPPQNLPSTSVRDSRPQDYPISNSQHAFARDGE